MEKPLLAIPVGSEDDPRRMTLDATLRGLVLGAVYRWGAGRVPTSRRGATESSP
jgi:hypothetical protein